MFDINSRDAKEGCIPPIKEGAIEDLQDEGEVLQREKSNGGAHRKEEALQGSQEQGQIGGAQVRLLLRLSYSTREIQKEFPHENKSF